MSQSIPASGRRFAGRTPDERRAERRAQLIAAAKEVYGARGYQASSVKAVCDAAGLTERYFYESFANSEDLLFACFQEKSEALYQLVRTAADETPGPVSAKVRAAVGAYLHFLRCDPHSARVFLIEMASIGPRADQLVSASLDRIGAFLVELIRRERRAAWSLDPLLVRGAIGGGLHVAQAWIANGFTEPQDQVVEVILKIYALMGLKLRP